MKRSRMSVEATVTLVTVMPSRTEPTEFRAWMGAYNELVTTHDGLVEEADELRDLLVAAKATLEECLRAAEQNAPPSVDILRLTLGEIRDAGE